MADPLKRFRPTGQSLSRSVLDRLLDDSPDLAQDPPQTIGVQMKALQESIRRDVEAFLNTRRRPKSPPSILKEAGKSLLTYGVDGFISANLQTEMARVQFARSVERRLMMFEPRLREVRVSVLHNRMMSERALRIRIEGCFKLEDGMPPIAFESSLDPSTQRFHVEAPVG